MKTDKNIESDFKDLISNGPFVGGPGRIAVERNVESPIEQLLFTSLAVLAENGTSRIGFFYRERDVLKRIDWQEHLSGYGDDAENFCKWYADQFDWHVYLQAGFPTLRKRVDAFAWRPAKDRTPLVIECDGFDFHSSKADMTRDRERDRTFSGMGYRVVRFTGSEIYNAPFATSCDLYKILS